MAILIYFNYLHAYLPGACILLYPCVIMGSNPASGSGMGRFADTRPERGVLLRHEPSPFARPGEFPIRRVEASDPPARRWQQDIEGIRDRVTISAWSLPGTAVRHETYNRNGSLSSTVHLPFSTRPAPPCTRAIRCEATIVMAQSSRAARRPAGTVGPPRVLSWSPVKALPGPA